VLIEARTGDDAGLTALLDAALKELFSRYPDSSSHFLDPATDFLVAIDEGDTVGCIGLMPIVAGVGEIKRMFVRQDQRGRGIARLLVRELERYALQQGADLLRLATGTRQPEAIALYESLGYQPYERYGKYVTDDHPIVGPLFPGVSRFVGPLMPAPARLVGARQANGVITSRRGGPPGPSRLPASTGPAQADLQPRLAVRP
jgi:putative acetyltransferase